MRNEGYNNHGEGARKQHDVDAKLDVDYSREIVASELCHQNLEVRLPDRVCGTAHGYQRCACCRDKLPKRFKQQNPKDLALASTSKQRVIEYDPHLRNAMRHTLYGS